MGVEGTWFDKKEPKKRTCFILKEHQSNENG